MKRTQSTLESKMSNQSSRRRLIFFFQLIMSWRQVIKFILSTKHLSGIACGVILTIICFAFFGCPEWGKKESSAQRIVLTTNIHSCHPKTPDIKTFEVGTKLTGTHEFRTEELKNVCDFHYNSTNKIKGELIGINNGSVYEGDIILTFDDTGKVQNTLELWPNKTVPYKLTNGCFNDNFTNNVILRAMKELEDKTCITFTPMSNESVHLQIDCNYGCSSQIGFWPNTSQTSQKHHRYMSIDPKQCQHVNVLHEFLHALGLQHMHNAHHRDSYVRICYGNGQKIKHKELFFRKCSANDSSYDVFDFESIMMLPLNAFSSDSNLYSFYPLAKNVSENIGQREALTTNDINFLNKLYAC